MEWFFFLLFLAPVGLLIALPIIALTSGRRQGERLAVLERRIAQLELGGPPPPPPPLLPSPEAPTSATPGRAPAMPSTPTPSVAPTVPAPTTSTVPPPPQFAPAMPSPGSAPGAPVVAASSRDMEQVVGGVWLQNAGAVLVLVGVFFLILWGWSTGRFGPGVLVGAGVLLGLGIAWRGERMRRTLPAFGHALVGTGLGVIYLALYTGHFQLGVLSGPVVFAALVATSALAVMAGLRYRVQGIAILGVIGAFLPELLSTIVPLHGLVLTPAAMLGYLAVVDVLVLVLAARTGWSPLGLVGIALGAFSWTIRVPGGEWSWPLEIGLSGVFTALGFTPLPWLARAEGRVRPADLAVVAITPLALIGCSWPMWAYARAEHVAMLLFALAAIYFAAAAWIDARRPERDLWQPLVGAAVVFLTAALERAVGHDSTPLAWTLEGVVLVHLGLDTRGGWLRACAYVVMTLGAVWTLDQLLTGLSAGDLALPVANAAGLRDAVSIVALLTAGMRLRVRRDRLRVIEGAVPGVIVAGANALLMLWSLREARHLALAFEGDGGRWRSAPSPAAPSSEIREFELAWVATVLAWLTQAVVLVRTSLRPSPERGWPLLRIGGHVLAAIAIIAAVSSAFQRDGWGRDELPLLYRDGLLSLAVVVLAVTVAIGLAGVRGSLQVDERKAPEFWAAGAAALMLAWIAREADHVARVALDVPGAYSSAWHAEAAAARERMHTLVPTFTSVGWLLQALVTLAIGWWRHSAFLRWMGLTLVGAIAVKIVLVDLAAADPFWRFLAAIAVGIAMLAVSYAYQRRRRREIAGTS